MNHLNVKYLLIGGGLASAAAAEAIRARDPEGSVLLVGQEIVRPYHRPPLSKAFLLGQTPRTALFTHEPGWFTAHRIELRTDRRVVHLDPGRAVAVLDDGEEVSFDRALIATGGAPVRLAAPGAELANVYLLRTLEDADRLLHATDKALQEGRPHPRGRGKAVVVGAGLLGVELAATLTQKGIAVTLVASGPHPWTRFAGDVTGKFLARFLEKQGVTVVPGRRPARLEGDGRVQRVVLDDGAEIACDFVVTAVGMTPHKELVRGTRIMAEHAILTDAHCRTNLEGIYAAGDCAAIYDPLFGKHRLIDHWDHAQVSGTLAGANMAGETRAYDAVNYFFSDVFDLTLAGWGEAKQVNRRLLRGIPNVEQPGFVEIGLAGDGRVAQVLRLGQVEEPDDLWRRLVGARLSLNGLEEAIKDPSKGLTQTLGL